jgi:formylglycine-generating enzyme required for sulfatase activity
MVLIPAGYFQMGSANGLANEAPVHPVLLDAFYIDQFEVTNAQYRACVSDGKCTRANSRNSFTHAGYRDDPAYDNYPVIGVTWDQASAYCGWAGDRLPTEAEWEYAARGPDSLVWPWGDTFDPGKLPAAVSDVQPVGSYPAGASPFGVFDMAGNVAEWVADVYDSGFYARSPASNPKNAGNGAARTYRGGAFDNLDSAAYTTSHRYTKPRTFNDVDVGFRCARNATEVNASASPEEHTAVVAKFCQAYGAYKPGAPCP